jgi:enoyl-CoA hydratase/carnithine racemase
VAQRCDKEAPKVAVHDETDGPVAIVTLDRHEAANAVDRPTADELTVAFRHFDADDAPAVADPHGRRRPVLRRS